MLACVSCTDSFASSTSICTKSGSAEKLGWMTLSATSFSKPPTPCVRAT
jgi:hypothetical protein